MTSITIGEKRFNADNVTYTDTYIDPNGSILVTVWFTNAQSIHLYGQEAEAFLEWWDSMVRSHPASWALYKKTVKKGEQ